MIVHLYCFDIGIIIILWLSVSVCKSVDTTFDRPSLSSVPQTILYLVHSLMCSVDIKALVYTVMSSSKLIVWRYIVFLE